MLPEPCWTGGRRAPTVVGRAPGNGDSQSEAGPRPQAAQTPHAVRAPPWRGRKRPGQEQQGVRTNPLGSACHSAGPSRHSAACPPQSHRHLRRPHSATASPLSLPPESLVGANCSGGHQCSLPRHRPAPPRVHTAPEPLVPPRPHGKMTSYPEGCDRAGRHTGWQPGPVRHKWA